MDTEGKILAAAITAFSEKGYDATRVRDIARLAGVNLALVNYYFKSKENLFNVVIRMKIKKLFGHVISIICDETTSLEMKLRLVSDQFGQAVATEPGLPAFVFGELQKKETKFIEILPTEQVANSSILRQIAEFRPDLNPLQFIMNMLSLMYFPYAIAPVMAKAGFASEAEFAQMLKDRQELVPLWVINMLIPEYESENAARDKSKRVPKWIKNILSSD